MTVFKTYIVFASSLAFEFSPGNKCKWIFSKKLGFSDILIFTQLIIKKKTKPIYV